MQIRFMKGRVCFIICKWDSCLHPYTTLCKLDTCCHTFSGSLLFMKASSLPHDHWFIPRRHQFEALGWDARHEGWHGRCRLRRRRSQGHRGSQTSHQRQSLHPSLREYAGRKSHETGVSFFRALGSVSFLCIFFFERDTYPPLACRSTKSPLSFP